MSHAEKVKSDTLTLLLSNAIHRSLPIKSRAIKISKCCKQIRDKTNDFELSNACRSIIKSVQNGKYALSCKAVELAEQKYFEEY